MKKSIVALIVFVSLLSGVFLLASPSAEAQFLNTNTLQSMNQNSDQLGTAAGYDQGVSLAQVVSVAIRGFLSLLGMVFIILMIVAGFNWMTAGGDEEKIKKAAATIRSAVIGLIIVASAYAITYFVFSNLPGSGSGTPPPPIN